MAKPKFDPNQPFQVVDQQGSKPKFDPNQPFEVVDSEQLNEGGGFIDSIIGAGEAIDAYGGGASTRAAIGALQEGENPFSAFANQYGEDPSLAPTGKQIVERAGVSDVSLNKGVTSYTNPKTGITVPISEDDAPSLSDVAGFAVDVVADPLAAVPVGAITKGAVKGVGKGVSKTASALPGAQKVSTATKVAKEGFQNTASALKKMFTPVQADDFGELVDIAKRNNIDPEFLPESIEFGEASFISRAARNRAEGVLGEPYLKKFEQGLQAVQDATENKIAQIGGGVTPNRIEAGEIIRQGYDAGVDKLFDQVGMTHSRVIQAVPKLNLSNEAVQKISTKLNSLEKWALNRSEEGFTAAQRAQGDQILRAIQAVRNANGRAVRSGTGVYEQMYKTMRDIGEVAFKSENVLADIPPDVGRFRDLYFTINDALIDTVGKVAGGPVADELRRSNELISNFLGEKSVISRTIGNKNIAPEKVFASLVEQGDTRKIEALKRVLPPEAFQQLKSAFLQSQIKKNADDAFTFKSFHNNLRNKKNVIGSLLDANEIQEVGELVRLGNRFGNPVLSSSGTGASNLFRDITQGIRSGVESDTVIGLMKDSARKKASRPLPKKANTKKLPPSTKVQKTNEKYRRLLAISPGAARVLSIQDKNGEPRKPIRGRNKWALDGFENLKKQDSQNIFKNEKNLEKLFSTAEGRNLLVQASNHKPGTRALDAIYMKIQKQLGKGR